MAKALFVLGLALIGLGILVFIFREILAAVAAVLLVLTGLGFCANAGRLLWHAYHMQRHSDNPDGAYRENVRIKGTGGTEER